MAYINTENRAGSFRVIGEIHDQNIPEGQFRPTTLAILKEMMHHDTFNSLGSLRSGDQYACTPLSAEYPDRLTIDFATQNKETKIGLAEPKMLPRVWLGLYQGGVELPETEEDASTADLLAAKDFIYGLADLPIELKRGESAFDKAAVDGELLMDFISRKRKISRNLLMAQTGIALARQYRRQSKETPVIDMIVGAAHMVAVSQALEMSDEERIRRILNDPQVTADYNLANIHERLLVQVQNDQMQFIPYQDRDLLKAVQRMPRRRL